jgi:restriction system protein
LNTNDPFAPLLAPLWTYVWVGLVVLAAIVLLRHIFRPSREKRAKRQHDWNRTRSWKDLKRIREIDPIKNPGPCFGWLRKVDPYRFEEMILSELARRGIEITRNTAYSGDGGIDGQFRFAGQPWLVQAKRYKGHIKQEHVWAFDAICQQRGARGLFIHTGKTPEALRQLKRQCGDVRVISGEELMKFFAGQPVSLELRPAERVSPLMAGKPRLAPSPLPPPGRESVEGAVS